MGEDFGHWLQAQITRHNLNQTGIGLKLGISQSAVSYWIAGRSIPSPEHCRKLALLFGLAEVEVLHAAGYVSETDADKFLTGAIMHQLHRLPPDLRRIADEFIEHLYAKWIERGNIPGEQQDGPAAEVR